MTTYSITAPNGIEYTIEGPAGASKEDVARAVLAKNPEAANPPKEEKHGTLEAIGAGLAGGVGSAITGAGAGIAALLGAKDTAASFDEQRKAIQEWQKAHGADSLAGEAASVAGGMAPAVGIQAAGAAAAPFTGGVSLLVAEAVNAGFFGIPAFRDAYNAQKEKGASEATAITHAAWEAGLATVGGKVIGSGGKILPKVMQAGEGLTGKLVSAGAAGAAFPELGRIGEKSIDAAYGQQNDQSWLISPREAGASALGFAALRGVQHPFEARAADKRQAAFDAASQLEEQRRQQEEQRQYSDPQAKASAIDTFLDLEQQRIAIDAAFKQKPDPKSPTYTLDVEEHKGIAEQRKDLRDQLAAHRELLNKFGITQTDVRTRAAERTQVETPQGETAPAPTPPGKEKTTLPGETKTTTEQTDTGAPGEEAPSVTEPAGFTAPTAKAQPYWKDPAKTLEELQAHAQKHQETAAELLARSRNTEDLTEAATLATQAAGELASRKGVLDEVRKRTKQQTAQSDADAQARDESIRQDTKLAAEHTAVEQAFQQARANPKTSPAKLAAAAQAYMDSLNKGGADAVERLNKSQAEGWEAEQQAVDFPRNYESLDAWAKHANEVHAQEAKRREAEIEAERNAPTGPTEAEPSGEPESQAIEAKKQKARDEAEALRKEIADSKEVQANARKYGETRPTDQGDLFGEKGVTERTRPAKATADSINDQLDKLPTDLHPDDAALVNRIRDNVDAIAANPDRAETIRDWLYRKAQGTQQVLSSTDGPLKYRRPTYRDATRTEDLHARDIHDMLDTLEQGKRSETETAETHESVAARNAYAKRMLDRRPLLQQRIKELSDYVNDSRLGALHRKLYDNMRGAMNAETSIKDKLNPLIEKIAHVEARTEELSKQLDAAKTAEAVADIQWRLADNATAWRQLTKQRDNLQRALNNTQDKKRAHATALYAHKGSNADLRNAFDKLQQYHEELAALAEAKAPKADIRTTRGGVQSDMFPEIPGQGMGEAYIPASRSDIGIKQSPEEFNKFMASAGLQAYREHQRLAGITAQRARALIEPITKRIADLQLQIASAHAALSKRVDTTALQEAKERATAQLNLILRRIEDDLSDQQYHADRAHNALIKVNMDLADLVRRREGKENTAVRALDELPEVQRMLEQAKETGAPLDEIHALDRRSVSLEMAVDTYMDTAPAALREFNKKRKELVEEIGKATDAHIAARQNLDALTERIDALYGADKAKAAAAVASSDAAITAANAPRPYKRRGEPSENEKALDAALAEKQSIESRVSSKYGQPETELPDTGRKDREAAGNAQRQTEQRLMEWDASSKYSFEEHRKIVALADRYRAEANVYRKAWEALKARSAAGEENPTMDVKGEDQPLTMASAEASMNRALRKAATYDKLLDREGTVTKEALDADVANAAKKVAEWEEKRVAAITALQGASRKANKDASPENIAAKEAAVKARDNAVKRLTEWRTAHASALHAQQRGVGIYGMEVKNSTTAQMTRVTEGLVAAHARLADAKYAKDKEGIKSAQNVIDKLEAKLAELQEQKDREEAPPDYDPNYEPKSAFEAQLMVTGELPMRRDSVATRPTTSGSGYGFRTGTEESKAGLNKQHAGNYKIQETGEIRQPHAPFGKAEQEESNRIAEKLQDQAAQREEETRAAATEELTAEQAKLESEALLEQKRLEQIRQDNEAAAQIRNESKRKTKSRLVEAEDVPAHSLNERGQLVMPDKPAGLMTKGDKATRAAIERGRKQKQMSKEAEDELYNDWDNMFLRGTSGPNDTPLSMRSIRALHEGNLQSALADIAANSKNPVARRIAAQFAKMTAGVRTHLVDEMPGSEPNAPGGTTRNGMNILLHREKGLSEETLIHEAAHALTLRMMDVPEHLLTADQRAAKRELEAMHEAIKGQDALENNVVKDADIREFVAESYGSNQVQKYMQSTPWRFGTLDVGKAQYATSRAAGKGRMASMWDAAKSAFMRLIGAKVPPQGPMHDRFMELAEKFLRTPEKSDVAGSKGAEVAHYRNTLDDTLRTGFGDARSLLQKGKDNRDSIGIALRQNLADHRNALREVMSRFGSREDKANAAMTITTFDAAPSNTMATLMHGAFKVDAKGNLVAGDNTSFHDVLNEIAKFPGISGEKALNLFHIQRVAARANAMANGWTALNFKDPAAMRAKAKEVTDYINSRPELKAAVERANAVYNEYNRGKLELLKATHALPEDVINRLLRDKSYVPFYRQNGDTINLIMPDGHPMSVGDIRTNPLLRSLKGGDEHLLGFVDGEVKNAHLLTQLAVENLGKQNIAKRLEELGKTRTGNLGNRPSMVIRKGSGPTDPNALVFRDKSAGEKDDGMRHIVIDTAGTIAQDIPTTLVAQAVAGSYSTPNMLTDMSHAMSSILRTGVTRLPLYTVKQLFKDPISASIQGHVRANPATAVVKSILEYVRVLTNNSPEAKILQKHGIIHSDVFGGTNDLNKIAKQITGGGTWWHSKVAALLDKSAMAADAATRVQAYKDTLAKGGTQTEALLQAREMQNFSRRGGAAWVQFFSHSIPFFNSSIQSMDTLLRSAQGKMPNEQLLKTKQTFAMRAAGMMAVAAAYYAHMDDDEKWHKMSLRDKLSYIHLPVEFGGERMRLPAPFEVGMMFYSLPIAMMEQLKYGLSKEDWNTVKDTVLSQLPGGGNPIPMYAKLPLDLGRNYDSLTGKPIIPKSQEGLAPEEQYGPKTTEFARRTAELTGVSPYKTDYALRQLFTGWANIAGSATESLFQKASESGIEKPEGHLSDSPAFGAIFQSARGNADTEHVYEAYARSKEAYATYQHMLKLGRGEDARQYGKEHRLDIAMESTLAGYAAELSNLKTIEDRIRGMKDMSGADKQAKLDKINERRQAISFQYQTALRRHEATAQP